MKPINAKISDNLTILEIGNITVTLTYKELDRLFDTVAYAKAEIMKLTARSAKDE